MTKSEKCSSIWFVPNAVGVFNGEGPPVSIPNTEVKLTSAENTCLETDWKDRSMPTQEPLCFSGSFLYLYRSSVLHTALVFCIRHWCFAYGIGVLHTALVFCLCHIYLFISCYSFAASNSIVSLSSFWFGSGNKFSMTLFTAIRNRL